MTTLKNFTIDLNLEPKDRYRTLVSNFNIQEISTQLSSLFDQYINGIPFGNFIVKELVNSHMDKIKYLDELIYWSELFQIPLYKVILMQLLYELNSACTTFVVPINNVNTMFRTMDWSMEFLKKMTYQATFIKNNKIIYSGVCWLGSVGIFTGKTNDYCIAINYRRERNISLLTIFKNYQNTVHLYWPVSYLTRHVLESGFNYAETIKLLSTAQIISPVYYIVTAFTQNNPLILQRDPNTCKTISNNHIIQTNCDYNDPGENIMKSIERIHLVNQAILKLNSSIDINKMIMLIYKYPVISHETIYFSVINNEVFTTFTI